MELKFWIWYPNPSLVGWEKNSYVPREQRQFWLDRGLRERKVTQ
jgi:hypothetical protein